MQYADSMPCSNLNPNTHCSVFRAHGPEKVGGYYIGGPPVPIPNTAVKPDCAEDTCLETDRKNRSLPTSLNPELKSSGFFLYTVRYAIMTARQNLEVSYYEIGRLWTIC